MSCVQTNLNYGDSCFTYNSSYEIGICLGENHVLTVRYSVALACLDNWLIRTVGTNGHEIKMFLEGG